MVSLVLNIWNFDHYWKPCNKAKKFWSLTKEAIAARRSNLEKKIEARKLEHQKFHFCSQPYFSESLLLREKVLCREQSGPSVVYTVTLLHSFALFTTFGRRAIDIRIRGRKLFRIGSNCLHIDKLPSYFVFTIVQRSRDSTNF